MIKRIELKEFARKAPPSIWITATKWASLFDLTPNAMQPRLIRYINRGFMEIRHTGKRKEYMMPADKRLEILALPTTKFGKTVVEKVAVNYRNTDSYAMFDLMMRA